jgi:hypothetical protein
MMGSMNEKRIIQGREITLDDIEFIKQLLSDHPTWNRSRLSRELCKIWHWHRPDGQMKDMACRTLLLKLERAGHITLPPRQCQSTNQFRTKAKAMVPHQTQEINGSLQDLLPLQITQVSPRAKDHALFNCLLSRYHYLGHRTTVGENIHYLVRDCQGRPLACVLFGSAAWKTAPRDTFIGWDPPVREKNLIKITNNTRFLILPWVKVFNLASHILSRVSQRIAADWLTKYSHPIYLLETFVDRSRFQGTCYRAANWIYTGTTQGRTRNDRNHKIQAPVKDVYVYPLSKRFRRELCYDNA